MTFCFHMILSTQESVPDSRVIAYDDNFKMIENASPIFKVSKFKIKSKQIKLQIPFPAITIVPQYSRTAEFRDIMLLTLWYGPRVVNYMNPELFAKFQR